MDALVTTTRLMTITQDCILEATEKYMQRNNFFVKALNAAQQSPKDFAKIFEEDDADPDVKEFDNDSNTNRYLIHAIIEEIPDEKLPPLLKILNENKVNLATRGRFRFTSITIAAQHQKVSAVNFLIAHNANTNDFTCPALRAATLYVKDHENESKSLEIVKILLANKAIINYQDEHGATALIHAAQQACLEIMRYLISKDAELFLYERDDRFGEPKRKTALGIVYEKYYFAKDILGYPHPQSERLEFVKHLEHATKCLDLLINAAKDDLQKKAQEFLLHKKVSPSKNGDTLKKYLSEKIGELAGRFGFTEDIKKLLEEKIANPILNQMEPEEKQPAKPDDFRMIPLFVPKKRDLDHPPKSEETKHPRREIRHSKRIAEYTPILLGFLKACLNRDDVLTRQMLESANVLFKEPAIIHDFFNHYRDDLYLSEDNLNFLYEKYNGVIFNLSGYTFYKLSDHPRDASISTDSFGLEILDGKLAYTTRNHEHDIVRHVKTDLDASDSIFFEENIRKIKQKILIHAMEAGHKNASDLEPLLLFAAKRGYVTLIKRMSHNEELLKSLFQKMINDVYKVESFKKIIENVSLTDEQKNTLVITCLTDFRLDTFHSDEERSEIISLYEYFIPLASVRWFEKLFHHHDILESICYRYRALIEHNLFNETLHPRYIALIQLLIDKDYIQNGSILHLEFLTLSLTRIGRSDLANEYLNMIYLIPQVKLYRAYLDDDFDKFETLARHYNGDQSVNNYLKYLYDDLGKIPDSKKPDFYLKWKASDLKKEMFGETSQLSSSSSVQSHAEEKTATTTRSALQANHLLKLRLQPGTSTTIIECSGDQIKTQIDAFHTRGNGH